MKNKIIPLDEKRIVNEKDKSFVNDYVYPEEPLKNSLQNLQEELKKEMDKCRDKTDVWASSERWNNFEKMFKRKINKLFLKHIGKGLIEIKEEK